uniref:Uncharacterized protein LOC111103720 n=1 Tax=Crassostrea virginica TaxID=6565 RepID=A0A8B8ANV5_CRAVI|nr:uncharacterized protein LOC111103720 [Crassostrea virginica]
MNVVVCFLFALTLKYTKSFCRSIQGETCCSGFYWNKDTSTCEKCSLGYHEINCSEICSYPSYGEDCQGKCNCLLSLCDYRYGCRDNNDTNGHTTFNFKTNTTVKTTSVSNVTEDSYFEEAILGILLVLFGLCAGVIFYKQCRRRNFTTVKQQEGHLVNNKSINELVANNLKSDEAVDPTHI